MATSFAAQLRSIAQNSTHELDLRARRTAHAESLLFPKDVAVKQGFDALYAICVEGFRELCSLDPAFVEYERNIFSAQSVRTEREEMNSSENEALDKVLTRCLAMLGGKVMLKPGVRCLEWLVRRFRVHVYNTAALLLSVLPWHDTPLWRNVLSIVPKEKCVGEWKFLGMYKQEALNVPRSAIVYAATNNDGFFAQLNRHVVDLSRDGNIHAALLKLWAGVVVEAVVGRLDAARSGRKDVQRQRMEDLLLKVLPILSDGFDVRGCPDLVTACFTLAMLLAGKADLDDRVLDSLLQAVAITLSFPETDKRAAVVTMAVITSQKQAKLVPKAALDALMTFSDLEITFQAMHHSYPVDQLAEALVTAAVSVTKRKYVASRLAFVERLLRLGSTLTQGQFVSAATQAVLIRVMNIDDRKEAESLIKTGLIQMLQRLNEETSLSRAISDAANKIDQDPAHLEALLGSTIATIEAPPPTMTENMEIDTPVRSTPGADELLSKIPSRTVDTISFFAKHDQHLFGQLVECFQICCRTSTALDRFAELQIWSSSDEAPLFQSFLFRVIVGSFPKLQKTAALQLLTDKAQGQDTFALQTFLPYILTALSDNSQGVRQAAADLLVIVEAKVVDDTSPESSLQQLYDSSDMLLLKSMAASNLRKIVSQALRPALEECVLDASRVFQIIRNGLNGPVQTTSTASPSTQPELKKSLRHDLFELLTSHAVATPSLRVKMGIIKMLDGVGKVGTAMKSKQLTPVLNAWASLNQESAESLANTEHLSLAGVDQGIISIISAQDKEAVGCVLSMLENEGVVMRRDLVTAFFDRLQHVWKDLKHDLQVSNAQKLFEVAFSESQALARGAQGVLRSVRLTTDILASLLEISVSSAASVQSEEQPKKRRRTSHGRDSLPPDMARMMQASFSRLTLILELVDDSDPATRPELMPVLFDVLSFLKRSKQQKHFDSPYVLNLCLGAILAIVDAQGTVARPTVDKSSIRADLVTDCVRSSESPQVQNTALLLSGSLAKLAPDRVLHNVMPIFTFMGQSMFSKEDDHSVHVVNQAIDQIIPALVDSLRNQKKDLIKSTSSLLASFTAAFGHIPQHRRIPIYSRLLDRMGSEEFAFVIFAMLSHSNGLHPSFDVFFADLLTGLSADVHLITYQKSLDLVKGVLSGKSRAAQEVFGINDKTPTGEKDRPLKAIFKVVFHLLESKVLRVQVKRLHKLDDDDAQPLRNHFNTCLRQTLAVIRDCRAEGLAIIEELKQCLDALLTLPSLGELFTVLPQILSHMETEKELKPQVLRVAASQVERGSVKNSKTRTAAFNLLAELTDMLQVETDIAMKQAIVICIDRLSDVYGRKDPQSVVSAASVIASSHCLDVNDRRLEIISLLCLASMFEVMKEASIPIVPAVMSRSVEILRSLMQVEVEDGELHNAVYALASAVVSHIPFLVSDEVMQAFLLLSGLSAAKYKSTSAVEARSELLSIIARNTDLQSLLQNLLGECLNVQLRNPEIAEIESLNLLAAALSSASKAAVIKNADQISRLLLAHLDQRARTMFLGDVVDNEIAESIARIEDKMNEISIAFVYKLNDTAFRPVFESWVDWATNAHDVEDSANIDAVRKLRQTSLFNLLSYFFDTLKSIVTSYASYVIGPANTILSRLATSTDSRKSSLKPMESNLYLALLNLLRLTFAHDADGFFTTPSHFEPLAAPLVAQLKLAVSKSHRSTIYDSVVPTIISLAAATIDTPSHHQTLSHELVQLKRSPSAAVRLASIKTLAALTGDENVGEEFLANVIGIGSGEGEGARGVGGGGSVGEVMIYVNEMLEDDDEDVEREVRRWVQSVREQTGEDVFEV